MDISHGNMMNVLRGYNIDPLLMINISLMEYVRLALIDFFQ